MNWKFWRWFRVPEPPLLIPTPEMVEFFRANPRATRALLYERDSSPVTCLWYTMQDGAEVYVLYRATPKGGFQELEISINYYERMIAEFEYDRLETLRSVRKGRNYAEELTYEQQFLLGGLTHTFADIGKQLRVV